MIRDVHIYFHRLDKITHVFINEKLKDTKRSRDLSLWLMGICGIEDSIGKSLQPSVPIRWFPPRSRWPAW